MGFISSASTLFAKAYMTELGRRYIFDSIKTPRRIVLPNGQTVDRLEITSFSLGDPDVNYNIPPIPQSGDIMDLAGSNGTGINGAKDRILTHLISPGDSDMPKETIQLVEYKQTLNDIKFDMAQSLTNLKTVVHQQLMTFVDGILVSDGVYIVTPTNYGKNILNNNELLIVLQEPTLKQDGYRLRIIFPTTGNHYNKMTFQFEKATTQTATVTTSVIHTVTAAPTSTVTSINTSVPRGNTISSL